MTNAMRATGIEKLTREFSPPELESIIDSGMDLSEKSRSASFVQRDQETLCAGSLSDAVELVGIEEALRLYPEVRDYYGRGFREIGRDYPEDTRGGYFIRVKKGMSVEWPVQSCLLLKSQGVQQKVHNLVIVEEGARIYVITGCSSAHGAGEAVHWGVSEFFIRRGGYLNSTMIHAWGRDVTVKPLGVAVLDEDAVFISNYVCLKPVKEITMNPVAVLKGRGARASFNSIILSHPGTFQDVGSRAILKAKGTQAEIISRAVSLGGRIQARGYLKSESPEVKAHLECRGLILSEQGTIHAIPELETDFRDVDMSHEAAIGKINREEIEYLCSRGFSKNEAQSIIIRGFMDVDILGLPDALKKEIETLEKKTLDDSF